MLEPGMLTVILDGQRIDSVASASGRVWLEWSGTQWRVSPRPPSRSRDRIATAPSRMPSGTGWCRVRDTRDNTGEPVGLREIPFRRREVLVQGNGSVDVVADTAFDPARNRTAMSFSTATHAPTVPGSPSWVRAPSRWNGEGSLWGEGVQG